MKKISLVIFSVLMIFGFASCNNQISNEEWETILSASNFESDASYERLVDSYYFENENNNTRTYAEGLLNVKNGEGIGIYLNKGKTAETTITASVGDKFRMTLNWDAEKSTIPSNSSLNVGVNVWSTANEGWGDFGNKTFELSGSALDGTAVLEVEYTDAKTLTCSIDGGTKVKLTPANDASIDSMQFNLSVPAADAVCYLESITLEKVLTE